MDCNYKRNKRIQTSQSVSINLGVKYVFTKIEVTLAFVFFFLVKDSVNVYVHLRSIVWASLFLRSSLVFQDTRDV